MMHLVDVVLRWLSGHVLGAKISLGWLIAVLVVVVLLPVPMKYHFLEAITWQPESAWWWPGEAQEMTGYYYSLNGRSENICESEHLTVSRFHGTVYARSRTTRDEGGTEDNVRRWTYNGGYQDGDYYLRYRPASILGQGSSFGLSYALRRSGREGVLFGEWIGIDSDLYGVVRCPYVLTSGPPRFGVSCEDVWPAEFNHRKQCEILERREPPIVR